LLTIGQDISWPFFWEALDAYKGRVCLFLVNGQDAAWRPRFLRARGVPLKKFIFFILRQYFIIMEAKLNHRRRVMKRVTVILMALALVLAGATVVLAQDVPQALKGVNLSTAQALTDAQAQQIRGAYRGGYQGWEVLGHNLGAPGENGQNKAQYTNFYDSMYWHSSEPGNKPARAYY
jgi:hypothetical protein